MVWNGSGYPVPVAPFAKMQTYQRLNPPMYMEYYEGMLFMVGPTTGNNAIFDIEQGTWGELVSADFQSIRGLIKGRGSHTSGTLQQLVGFDYSSKKIVDFSEMFTEVVTVEGGSGEDHLGTDVAVDICSALIGDTVNWIRPERAYITYLLLDNGTPDPTLTLTIYNDMRITTSNSAYRIASIELPVTSLRYVTHKEELSINAAPALAYELAIAGVASWCLIKSIVIEGTVEGMGGSPP